MEKAKLIEKLKAIKADFDSYQAPEECEGAIWVNYNEVCGLLTSLNAPVPDGKEEEQYRRDLTEDYLQQHCGNYTDKEKAIAKNAVQVGWELRKHFKVTRQ